MALSPEKIKSNGQVEMAIYRIKTIRSQFPTPEEIHEGPDTSPSQQLLKIFPSYKKMIDGPLVTNAIGIEQIRNQCAHFNEWLANLERLH